MIINGITLLKARPIVEMESKKIRYGGVSYGLGEAGYDIRIKQNVQWDPMVNKTYVDGRIFDGNFVLASAIECFDMRDYMAGIVHDKSTWARRGLSVFNTVIEPGWRGFLTLELVFHGNEFLNIPAGAGIAQVIFHQTSSPASYTGKYQDQVNRPQEAING